MPDIFLSADTMRAVILDSIQAFVYEKDTRVCEVVGVISVFVQGGEVNFFGRDAKQLYNSIKPKFTPELKDNPYAKRLD